MSLLPVAERELRGASRRPATYRTRGWAVGIAVVVFAGAVWRMSVLGAVGPGQGRPLFAVMSSLAFLYCLFIGAWITADCLSSEKREGTLGLLFLTDLKAYDIVWGKLTATSLSAFYALLAIVPTLVLPLQLGGVTGGQMARILLILLNTFFFSLTLGLYISATGRDERRVLSATLGTATLCVLAPGALLILLSHFAPQYFNGGPEVLGLLFLSAGYAFVASLVEIFVAAPIPRITVWASVLIYHLLAWYFLWRACRVLPKVWQADAKRGWLARCQDALEQWGYGRAEARRRHRCRLLDVNPFLWLASRDRWKPRYVWFLLVAVGVTWYLNTREGPEMVFEKNALIPAIVIVNGFLKIWLASEASAHLMADRRAGSLELLLTTPLLTREIVHGQWLALRRQFGWPVATALAVEAYALSQCHIGVEAWVFLAVTVADFGAMGWAGLWFALSSRSTARALAWVATLVVALPWLAYGVVMVFVQLTLSGDSPGLLPVYLWFAISLATDVGVGYLWARGRLRRGFRSAAQQW